MRSYFLDKSKYNGEIIYMEYDLDGYEFKPKNTLNAPYIEVNSVTVYEPVMIDNLLAKRFSKKFDRLSQIIMKYLYEEDDADEDEGDFMILLDEVQRLKMVVENKYKRFLQVEEYKDYIHKLAFLDNELRQKLAIINYHNSLEYEPNKGRGR